MTSIPLLASTRPLPGAVIDARVWLTLARIGTGFFVPLLGVMVTRHGLPNLLVAVIAGCFLVSGAGWAFDWYGLFWWFDVVIHFVNPLVMMAGSMFMLWKADLLKYAPRKGRFVLWSTA